MSPVILIQLACLVSGGIFAGIAAWLTSQKGNTIKEILESEKELESINVEIKDQLKLKANLPIVALYVIAAAVAVGVPALINWQLLQRITIVTISGAVQRESNQKVRAFEQVQLESTGFFKVRVPMTAESRIITFEGENNEPMSMEIIPHRPTGRVEIAFSNSGSQGRQIEQIPIDLETFTVTLAKPIALRSNQPFTSFNVQNSPSVAKAISPQFQNIGEPDK